MTCSAWYGSRKCASSLTTDFGATHVAWPDLQASVSRNVLTLTGRVPDAATHWAVVDRAHSAVQLGHVRRVVDRLTLMDRPAPAGVDATASRVAAVASLCEAGGATLTNGILEVRCEVSRELEPALRELAEAPLLAGYLGEVRLMIIADSGSPSP